MAKQYQQKDKFYRRAKQDGFAARSVYKLEELDARFTLLKKGDKVLDLGCSPGSWLQYIASKVGERGYVLGYDIVAPRVNAGPQVVTFVVDAHELTPDRVRHDAGDPVIKFNAVVSDMAPKTTGIRDADQAKSIGLVEQALALAQVMLTNDGVFAAKVFQGRGFDELMRDVRKSFIDVRALRPKATRQGSREAFIIAKKRRIEA